MPRYRSFGQLDDVPVEDGDVGFSGMNLRLPVWQLPAGMLSLSANGRIDGEWVPRRGIDVVTEGTLASGVPLRLPFWLVDDNSGSAEGSQGLAVAAASRNGELVTLTVTGHGFPVGGSAASVVVNPSGADNSVLFTADAPGPGGNLISIEYAAPAAIESVAIVTVGGNAITVIPASKGQMVVSGTLSPDATGAFARASRDFFGIPSLGYLGVSHGITRYDHGDAGPFPAGESADVWTILAYYDVPNAKAYGWRQTGNTSYDFPDMVSEWVPFVDTPAIGGELAPVTPTGTPVLTAALSTASFVIAEVNFDPISSALVTASPSGAVTGAVAAIGPIFLQGSAGNSAFLGLEGVTGSPTADPNGAWLMTPTDADTLTFSIPGAPVGVESYTITTARVLSELDDFSTGDVLGSCLFSDPSGGDNDEYVFLAYGIEVQKVKLSDGTVVALTLPGTETIDGEINMIQAMDKVFLFREGKVALQWVVGGSAFTAVASGPYTQPQILTSAGTAISAADGLVEFTVVGNTTIAANDQVTIYSASDVRFLPFVLQKFTVASISGTTIIRCYIPVPDSASGSNTVQIGKPISFGGGYIHQPGFPWAIYFQRRLWGPYRYFWDVSLTPDGFTDRDVTDEVIAGDILDPDTFDPLSNQFRITGGTADHIVSLHPFFDDTLLVMCRNSIHSISGTVGSLLDCSVHELTREIGCLARKSIVTQGNNVFFLSDNGVYGLAFEDLYNLRGIERPLSEKIQPYIDRISLELAPGAVAAYHNNRYWLAVPLDSAPRQGDATGNNVILVYNLLNREWESVDTFNDPNFLVTDFIIATAGARNDLYAVTSAGGIHILDKLDEDYDRIATNPTTGATHFPIDAYIQTRGFMGGTTERKRFTQLGVQLKSGSAQSDIGVSFATDDPDNIGAETLASATMAGPLEAENSADVRMRVGGLRGFTGIVTVRREIGRPRIRGIKVGATITNQAVLTQK